MLGREGGGVVMIDIFRATLVVSIGGTTAANEEVWKDFRDCSPTCGFYAAAGLPEQSFIRSISQRPAGPGGADVG
jgi:hypothetical protein